MSDTRRAATQFLAERASSYLQCDHGDGLNHANFDVEKLMSEYAAAVLEEVIAKLNALIDSFRLRNEPTGMLEMARNRLVERAAQERGR